MRFIVDTHTLIWWWSNHPNLPSRLRDILGDSENSVYVSAATGWEMATKVRSGRLPEMVEPVAHFDESVVGDGFHHLAVRYDHGVRAGLLPGEHRDPFDRLIAAQALIEGLTVITRDPALAAFGCAVIW